MKSSSEENKGKDQTNKRSDIKSPGASNRLMPVRKHRFTVHLPIELIERIRNATYWMPKYTLSRLSEEAYIAYIDKLEKERGKPFPMRVEELREGRPLGLRKDVEPDIFYTEAELGREKKELLNADQVASYFGISKYLVYNLVKTGELPHYRIGRCIRFGNQDIERYLKKVHEDK